MFGSILITVIITLAIGISLTYVFMQQRYTAMRHTLGTTINGMEDRISNADDLVTQMESTFKALASDVLGASIETLNSQAGEKLKAIGEVITTNLTQTKDNVSANLGKVSSELTELHARTAAVDAGLKANTDATQLLNGTASTLREVLSSNQLRGQWGERMVEDILDKLGMIEGVNYSSQSVTDSGERPDFSFNLPDGKIINMDVKFPLNQYEKFLGADDADVKEAAKKKFLKDVRAHAKALEGRGYIDTTTTDYLLMFIPNESIYSFIHENDPEIIDFALQRKIVLCAPMTLYAVLSLIRESIKSFALSAQTGEILALLDEFQIQWSKYVEKQDKVGESLAQAQGRYDEMVGARTKKLTAVVLKINEIEKPSVAQSLAHVQTEPLQQLAPPPPPSNEVW